jgi:hypothetical protein
MKTLLFNPQKCFPPTKGAHCFDGLTLTPGASQWAEDDLETLLNHPDFARYDAWGAVEILGETAEIVEPKDTTGLADLSGMGQDDIEKLLELTHDVETLKAWLEKETRRPVRSLINRRLTAIAKGEE